MKRLLFILAATFVLASCFKSDSRDLGTYNISEGYIKYQVNDFPMEFNGGYAGLSTIGIGVYAQKQIKSSTVPATKYTISGQLGASKPMSMVIVTDSLKTGTYTTSATPGGSTFIKIDSIQYSNNRSIDFLTVNITRYSSGSIDGNFSGKLSSGKTANGTTTYADGNITNGSFQNVAIRY